MNVRMLFKIEQGRKVTIERGATRAAASEQRTSNGRREDR